MPKYEYACKSCREHIEVVQSFSDAQLTECPTCGGVLRKVFGAPGISFKGSGFYRTDNRKRRTEPKEAKADSASDTKSDQPGAGSKSESASSADGKSDSSSSESGGSSQDGPAKKEAASSGEAKPSPNVTEAKTA